MSELQDFSCSAFALHDQDYNNVSGNQKFDFFFFFSPKEIAQDILEIYNLFLAAHRGNDS